jgi:hypothetical protein
MYLQRHAAKQSVSDICFSDLPCWLEDQLPGKQQPRRRFSASMNRAVRARTGCARIVLEEVDTASAAAVSCTQKAALTDLIRREKARGAIGVEEAADLSTLICKVRWHGEDGAVVQRELTTADRNGRRVQQDYTKFLSYITKSQWEFFSSGDGDIGVITDVVQEASLRLNLRTPTEPTAKLLSSLCAVLRAQKAVTMKFGAVQKQVMYQNFKNSFRRKSRQASHPSVYLAELPANPADLKMSHPDFWDLLYGKDDEPVPMCPKLRHDVIAFDQSYSCRYGKPAHPMESSLALVPSGGGVASTSLDRVATALIEGVAALALQQQNIVEMFSQGRPGGSMFNMSFPQMGGRKQHFAGLSPPEADARMARMVQDAEAARLPRLPPPDPHQVL